MTAMCRCRHLAEYHHRIRRRVICLGSPVCGCGEFRPETATPAPLDERYDPSPEPIDRRTK